MMYEYTKNFWCPWRESDPRPLPYQGSALPLSHKGNHKAKTLKNQTKTMERETGIEPASLAWKARVLPLNYSRKTEACAIAIQHLRLTILVEGTGFEPV